MSTGAIPATASSQSETRVAHDRETYLPRVDRTGIGLCLSGGGTRASLFHLGVLRRLNELGLLSRVRTISCVSGGSILGAHLARTVPSWPEPGQPIPDFPETVARPFEGFARRNLRTAPLARRLLLPWNWPRSQTQIDFLADEFERHLSDGRLCELPPKGPRFLFCASDNAFGVNWIFSRDLVGDYQVGYVATPAEWKTARAVAASACFPPVFDPMRLDVARLLFKTGNYKGPRRDELIRGLCLSDGGLYDNLALEPVWKDHRVVIVSDGGATFDPSSEGGLLWKIKRYASIMGRQSSSVRKRWLIAGYLQGEFKGAYLGIGTPVSHYPKGMLGYPEDLVDDLISQVRTDLDAFSEAEIAILQNHGYLVAEAAATSYLVDPSIPLISAPLEVPYPGFMLSDLVKKALAHSSEQKLPFGRGNWLREFF